VRRAPFLPAFVWLVGQALLMLVLFRPSTAFGAGSKSVAVYIEGSDADSVVDEVKGVLPSGLTVIDSKKFADALKKSGPPQLGSALWSTTSAREKVLARVQRAIEETNADAALVGRVRMGKAGKEVYLVWLRTGGGPRINEPVSLKGSSSDRTAAFHSLIDGPAGEIAPAQSSNTSDAVPDEKPQVTTGPDDGKDKDEPKSSRTAHLRSTEIFDVGVAFEMGARHVAFTDPISPNIRPYDVLPAPMIAVQGEVYPAATTGIPVLKNIGLAARFSMALGLSSSTKNSDTKVQNTWIRFRGGLKWRIIPASDTGPMFALTGDFGFDTFSFENAGDLAGSVPSVDYKYVRAGGEVRLPIGPVAIELGGGYRGLLTVGEMGDRFTKNSALAFDGFIGFAVTLPKGFEARLSGDYTRVFYAFTPSLGDAYVAGGAVDEMLGARIGVAYVY
jgi:hypothetical protein